MRPFVEEIKKREVEIGNILIDAFGRFKDGVYDDKLGINPATVKTVVRSWIDDLDRYSQYHAIDPDKFKRAAFMMFWVSKLKPIPPCQ